MTDKMSPYLLLRVPVPSKASLSFSEASPREFKRWIAGLPKANIGETARQLYQALAELNQLQTPADNRLQLLELIRPEVYFVCEHLQRHFLNKAIVLEERPRKVANLCQALQNHLAMGYKLIVVDICKQPSKELATTFTVALQRAISSLCAPLVRATQLYCPVPERIWLELHLLYQIARSKRLHSTPVPDKLNTNQSSSSEQSYLVALLIGCARCNQLRQSSIAHVAQALESWSHLAHLKDKATPTSLFTVAVDHDSPPRYTSLLTDQALQHTLGLDTHALVDMLKEYLLLEPEQRKVSRLSIPAGMSLETLHHLSAAWGDLSERTFNRLTGQGKLTVCLGMSAVHFFLSGERSFSQCLKAKAVTREAVFNTSSLSKDSWSQAYDVDKSPDWENGLQYDEIGYYKEPSTMLEDDETSGETYPSYPLAIINHSPGGYCLTWPGEVPSQLQAGELVGVRDLPELGWSIAVVRWIRQARAGGTQMGIELIAPSAQACGLQLVRTSEQNSEYLRALVLPEMSAISRPASLLTPRLPFQEGSKVRLNINGLEHRAVLLRRKTSTGSFSQFEYRQMDQPPPEQGKPVTAGTTHKPSTEEDFDSLWKSL
ncbi:hypothetical protein SAMN05216264_103307 [Pseudomonas marincola]|nr:hypothetical protein SAMN05216264_103307 [Pseudomonas marincola]